MSEALQQRLEQYRAQNRAGTNRESNSRGTENREANVQNRGPNTPPSIDRVPSRDQRGSGLTRESRGTSGRGQLPDALQQRLDRYRAQNPAGVNRDQRRETSRGPRPEENAAGENRQPGNTPRGDANTSGPRQRGPNADAGSPERPEMGNRDQRGNPGERERPNRDQRPQSEDRTGDQLPNAERGQNRGPDGARGPRNPSERPDRSPVDNSRDGESRERMGDNPLREGSRDGNRGPGLNRGADLDRGRDLNRGPDLNRGQGTNRTRGGSSLQRLINDPNYFTRDRNNQRLDYLRIRNSDVLDRIARNPRNLNLAFANQNFRVRPINPGVRANVNFRYRNPINFFNFGSSIARRLLWLRGNQLAGYRFDPRFNIYRDFRGRRIGRYFRPIFLPTARFIVPHYNRFYNGSFFCNNGGHFYYPDTFSMTANASAPPEPVEMQFGEFDYSDDLTYRFVQISNEVALDMHYNYTSNPDFEQTYREAYDLLLNAKDIRAAVEQGDQQQAASILYGLDQLFYHLLDQVADWERTEQKPIGQEDLLAKMTTLEATMQHLMHDLGVEPSFEIVDETAPLPGPQDLNQTDSAPINPLDGGQSLPPIKLEDQPIELPELPE